MSQISPILLYWCVRSIPPVKQLSSMHMVLGWQHIFLLEDNWFGLIYSLYILCLCSEQMYTHVFMYYHCFIVWKTYCLNLLELQVLINHIMKYIWYITSVSKPWGKRKKKLFHAYVLGTFCSCSSLSHFSWLQSETQQMRADLFSTLQMCWNEFSHSPHRMLFLFTAVQIFSTSEDHGSKISQQATDILFPNLACGRRQKNCHLAGFTCKHHASGFYMKYV